MRKAFVLFLLLTLLAQKAHTESTKAIVIVANSTDYDGEYRQFFERNDILAFYASPKKFSQFKQYKNILIVGGPDARETGEIVKGVLTEKEIAFLRQKGSSSMFKKEDVWAEGQKVFVVAGWDRHATAEAVWKNIKGISLSLSDVSFISSSGEILWIKDNLEEGFAQARVEDKLVLVYVWASWCSWCEKMEADVFPDARVKEAIARYYVPVRLDYDRGTNADFAHSHYIWGTPAFLVFDKDKNKIGFMDGYQSLERFLSRLLKYASP